LYQKLLTLGVIVRPLKAFGLPSCMRITIGTEEQNHFLFEALHTALEEVRPAVA
jgi:histidinol-phosphate aminotransferase